MYWIVFILLMLTEATGQHPADFIHGPNFNLDCKLCHTTKTWKVDPQQILFDHNTTGFRLLGAHRQVECLSCHNSLVFSHIGHNCIDCHQDVHQGRLGVDCERCHSPDSWENRFEVFEIHQNTRFPLYGIHAVIDCQSCHDREDRQDFKLKSVECQQCHIQDFLKTINPSHQKAGFSLQCENCHLVNAASWKQAIYEHSETFPLVGGHSNLECVDCHNDRYQGVSVECYACHQDQYESTTNPNHMLFGFPTNCQECHSPQMWERSDFDHLSASGFALVGVHARSEEVKCIDCHVNNQLRGLPRDCYGCHQNDYNRALNPNHVTGNFPQDCLICHNQEAWSPSDFDHNRTAFPLTGAHQTAACEDCHTDGQYSGIATDCYSCHQNDFNQTTDPDHQQSNFSHDCTNCHSTTSWTPATFDHAQTNFPLTGAHQNVQCIDCHASGYENTPTSCVSCHQQDYDATTDPNHQAANFPFTCEDCHSTTAWQPANWDHDAQYFPIYSGSHQGAWDTCSDCHVNSADYSQFECITCHEHERTTMDAKHSEVTNYVYESRACYDCHPQGKEAGD
ncbi:hypothetical protein Calab_3333 [Caldithrix abyssi DSM 13497]|uniref:Cytochrome c family protein n=1 Tax=Caldithrix abyssi DSM 13497 TaxID=880073 RepID=H1XVN7_CALAY|nr:hypothetical protein [Caldithrix abyssi]APF18984.1 cytochrome c family protein [Caldithrix abyssi DSM 13497]EHO42937.1 hypothetical protein Calab_3333 [Caldithrix abyssi DSM 13497]